MRKCSWILWAAGALVVTVCLGGEPASGPAATGAPPGFAADKPETWEPAIKRAQGDLDAIADVLIRVARGAGPHAQDEELGPQERLKAIMTLGRIGNDKAIDFLVTNVAMRFESSGDYPCLSSLLHSIRDRGQRDWRVAQAVFRSLDQPKTRTELVYFSKVLDDIWLNMQFPKALVEKELEYILRPARQANLEQLKEFLSH